MFSPVRHRPSKLIVAPEHDQIKGDNILSTFGALHYITKQEIDNSSNVFSKYNLSENDKIVSLILGGPNRYYDFNEIDLGNIFLLIKDNFLDKNFKLILVRSRRTPDNIIDFAKKFFLEQGVRSENLIFENKSRSTFENINYSKDIIKNNKGTWGLITSDSTKDSIISALSAN